MHINVLENIVQWKRASHNRSHMISHLWDVPELKSIKMFIGGCLWLGEIRVWDF